MPKNNAEKYREYQKKKQKGVTISSTECDASRAPQKAFGTSTKIHNENENVADSVGFEKNLDLAIKIEPHDAIFNEDPIAIKDEIVKYEVLEFGENEESCIVSPGIESLADQQQNDTEEILCDEFISNAASAQNHGRTRIQCEVLRAQRKGSKHSLDKNVNRPFKCPQCPKDFAKKCALRAHSKIHTDRERPYQCDVCDKAFLNQQNLNEHRKLHSGVKSFACEICSKTFSRQYNLLAHKIMHSDDKPFICSICGRAFARKPEMKDHERIHTGERPFQCNICQMAFVQRANLRSHIKSTHFNEKKHKCELCERTFKRRRLLDYHIKSIHNGERPHMCKICGASFVYPEQHKKHMIIHLGNKPFACEVCGKQFNSRDNRNAHRFVHSDKKPYECLECGAGFMRKPLLLAHIKQTKHSNDTIIVNQPQISLRHDATAGKVDDMVEETYSTTNSQAGDAENIAELYEDMMQHAENDDSNDVITRVSGQVIKDEIGDVKYLEFKEIDDDGRRTLTWVDIVDKDS